MTRTLQWCSPMFFRFSTGYEAHNVRRPHNNNGSNMRNVCYLFLPSCLAIHRHRHEFCNCRRSRACAKQNCHIDGKNMRCLQWNSTRENRFSAESLANWLQFVFVWFFANGVNITARVHNGRVRLRNPFFFFVRLTTQSSLSTFSNEITRRLWPQKLMNKI